MHINLQLSGIQKLMDYPRMLRKLRIPALRNSEAEGGQRKLRRQRFSVFKDSEAAERPEGPRKLG